MIPEEARATSVEKRVRFRDLKPYEIPDSWESMRGPYRGVLELPIWVRWQDDRRVDIGDQGGLRMAYQALLSEGTAEIQMELLNCDRLLEAWPKLSLDIRVSRLWETRFQQLKAGVGDSRCH